MDYRPYILAGTFLLLIGALITFIVTLRRARRSAAAVAESSSVHAAPAVTSQMDTSLDGLDVALSANAPSASLHTPIRESEWMPPAPAGPDVAFAEAPVLSPAAPEHRDLASFVPEVEAADEVAVPVPPSRSPLAAPATPLGSHREEEASVEEADGMGHLIGVFDVPVLDAITVQAPEPEQAVADPSAADDVPTDLFAEEIAALLPSEESPQAMRPTDDGTSAGGDLPVIAMPVEDVVTPQDEEPAPVAYDVPLAPEPVEESPPPLRAPTPELAPVRPRPVVEVLAVEPPRIIPDAPAPAPVERAARPRVRVHGVEGSGDSDIELALTPAPVRFEDPLRAQAPQITMDAPVEMYFGEARVGVKAGTPTFERFMKYADVLFEDLKATRREAR